MIDPAILTEYATATACLCAVRGYCADVPGPLACPHCARFGPDDECPAAPLTESPDSRMTTWRGIGGGPVQRAVRGTVRGRGRNNHH